MVERRGNFVITRTGPSSLPFYTLLIIIDASLILIQLH